MCTVGVGVNILVEQERLKNILGLAYKLLVCVGTVYAYQGLVCCWQGWVLNLALSKRGVTAGGGVRGLHLVHVATFSKHFPQPELCPPPAAGPSLCPTSGSLHNKGNNFEFMKKYIGEKLFQYFCLLFS